MKSTVLLKLLAVAVLAYVAVLALRPAKSPGEVAAESWLKLVDSGDSSQSWDQSSEFFRARVARDAWVADLERDRRPLGRAHSRKLKSAQYVGCPAGFAFGRCMRIRYQVSCDGPPSAIETVGMVKEDGHWRVAGYFLNTKETVGMMP